MNARFRVGLRLQRFEILASLVAGTVLASSALLVWSKLNGLHLEGGCFTYLTGLGPVPPCTLGAGRDPALAAFNDINNSDAIAVMLAMAVLPLLIGMVLGLSLIHISEP